MNHHYDIDIQVAQLRHQEFVKQAEEYRQFAALIPQRPRLTDRLLHSLATILIALGQALQSGSRGSARVIGLVMLLLGACSAATGPSMLEQAAAVPVSASTSLSAPLVAGWQTYREPVSGVAFEHPPGWQIDEPTLAAKNMGERYTIILNAEDGELDALAAGEAQVQLTVIKAPTGTLAEIVAQQKAELLATDPGLAISAEELWTLTWRRPAVYLRLVGSQGPAGLLVAASGDKTVLLSGTGDLEIFQVIAHTLQIKHKYGPT